MTNFKENYDNSKMILSSLCAFILLILIAMVYAHTLINSSHYLFHTDFFKFYQSARFYYAGQSIYDKIIYPLNAAETLFWHQKSMLLNNDLNPPFLTLLLLPTVWFSYSSALTIWFIFSMITMVIGVFLILKLYPTLWCRKSYCLWALCGLMLYFPNYLNLYIGQLSSILLVLTILSLHACHINKLRTTGILLGAAFSIKLFYGLFLVLFLVRKQWQVVVYMLLTFLMCSASALSLFGMHTYKQYFLNLKHIYWYSANWNGSLLGFLTRLFGSYHEGNYAIINLPQITYPLYLIISTLLLGIFVGVISSSRSDDQILNAAQLPSSYTKFKMSKIKYRSDDIVLEDKQQSSKLNYVNNIDWQFSFTIVLMLLISPLGWVYYFSLLMVPFIVILRLNENLTQFNSNFLLFSLVILLSSVPVHYRFPMEITGALQVFTWSSYYFYALVLVFVLLLHIRKQLMTQSYVRLEHALQTKFSSQMQLLIYLILAIPSLVAFIVAMSASLKLY